MLGGQHDRCTCRQRHALPTAPPMQSAPRMHPERRAGPAIMRYTKVQLHITPQCMGAPCTSAAALPQLEDRMPTVHQRRHHNNGIAAMRVRWFALRMECSTALITTLATYMLGPLSRQL